MNSTQQKGILTAISETDSFSHIEKVFQKTVKEIAALPGQLVRPRYQSNPPARPHLTENWVALGITEETNRTTVHSHDESNDGTDKITAYNEFTVLISCYGRDAFLLAARIADGLQLSQNRAELRDFGIAILHFGVPIFVPELFQTVFVRRVDLPIFISYRTTRSYGVKNLTDASLNIKKQ